MHVNSQSDLCHCDLYVNQVYMIIPCTECLRQGISRGNLSDLARGLNQCIIWDAPLKKRL